MHIPDPEEISSGNLLYIAITVSAQSQFFKYPVEAACILHTIRGDLYAVEIRSEPYVVYAGDLHGVVNMVGYTPV